MRTLGGGGAAESLRSDFSSVVLKGRKEGDMGERSGVRGMLSGRMAGWMGCRDENKDGLQHKTDLSKLSLQSLGTLPKHFQGTFSHFTCTTPEHQNNTNEHKKSFK